MQFRIIEDEDYDKGLIELLGQLTSIDKSKISPSQYKQYVETVRNNPLHHTVVCESNAVNSKIIATGTIFCEQKLIHNLGIVGHIEDIVVDKEHRESGIGSSLIKYLTEYGKSHGCYKVILDCDESNVRFYERCGYKRKGTQMAMYFE